MLSGNQPAHGNPGPCPTARAAFQRRMSCKWLGPMVVTRVMVPRALPGEPPASPPGSPRPRVVRKLKYRQQDLITLRQAQVAAPTPGGASAPASPSSSSTGRRLRRQDPGPAKTPGRDAPGASAPIARGLRRVHVRGREEIRKRILMRGQRPSGTAMPNSRRVLSRVGRVRRIRSSFSRYEKR